MEEGGGRREEEVSVIMLYFEAARLASVNLPRC
jgi:hypothetical protein